jgi:hypothetical protein
VGIGADLLLNINVRRQGSFRPFARHGRASVLNLKFATLLDRAPSELQIQKSTLESIFSSVAYDSEIRSEPSIKTWRISESPH